jgi:uncharacterized protein YbaA (DUF1428 family)
MRYVDGFVLAVPEKNLKVYRNIAQKAGKSGKSMVRWNTSRASATTSTLSLAFLFSSS